MDLYMCLTDWAGQRTWYHNGLVSVRPSVVVEGSLVADYTDKIGDRCGYVFPLGKREVILHDGDDFTGEVVYHSVGDKVLKDKVSGRLS